MMFCGAWGENIVHARHDRRKNGSVMFSFRKRVNSEIQFPDSFHYRFFRVNRIQVCAFKKAGEGGRLASALRPDLPSLGPGFKGFVSPHPCIPKVPDP
jgi:hypothetical protein